METGWAPPRRERSWPLVAASVGRRKRGRAGAEPGAAAADSLGGRAAGPREAALVDPLRRGRPLMRRVLEASVLPHG